MKKKLFTAVLFLSMAGLTACGSHSSDEGEAMAGNSVPDESELLLGYEEVYINDDTSSEDTQSSGTEEIVEPSTEAEKESESESETETYGYSTDEILAFKESISMYQEYAYGAFMDDTYCWVNFLHDNYDSYEEGGYMTYFVDTQQGLYFCNMAINGKESHYRMFQGTYDVYLIYRGKVYQGKEQVVLDRDSEGVGDFIAEIYIEEFFPDAFE